MKFLLLIISCILSASVFSQNIIFEHITDQQGLSQNDINGICQDNDGFLWIATHNGLNKYDGYSFKTFLPDPANENSILSNLIQSVHFDRLGYIWSVHTNLGFSRLDPKTEKFLNFKYDKTIDNGIVTSHINHIFMDVDEQIWVGTQHGISIINSKELPENKTFDHFFIVENDFYSPKNDIRFTFQDSKEQLWIGTGLGLYRIFRNTRGKISSIIVSEKEGLPTNTLYRDLIEDNYGNLILTSKNGAFIKPKNEPVFKKFYDDYNMDLDFDNQGRLWGGNYSGLRLFEYDSIKKTYIHKKRFASDIRNPNSLNRNSVRNVFVDRSNVIWVGTEGGGINKMNPEGNPFVTIKAGLQLNSLSKGSVRSVLNDSHNQLWVGVQNGNLNVSFPNDQSYNRFQKIKISNVFSILEVDAFDEKYILIGIGGGHLKKSKLKPSGIYTTEDFTVQKDSISSVFTSLQTKNKDIWLGTYDKGLHRLRPSKENTFKKTNFLKSNSSISGNTIRHLMEDSKENLWIATSKGLNFLSKEEKQKKNPTFKAYKSNFEDKKSISNDYILNVFEAKDGTIWIGTFTGLNKYIPATANSPEYFKRYNSKNGLPDEVIKAIEEDENGNLWLSSNKGLTKFDPNSDTIQNYDVNDGLQSNEFIEPVSLKCNDNRLVFGGINGLNIFDSEKIKKNNYIPSPLFTDFYITNKKIGIGNIINNRLLLEKSLNNTQEIVLKPNENSFSIGFTSSHMLAPKKNKFQYKLEGFDNDWTEVDADNRTAKYTNIPSGDYTFKVRASNSDGVWSTKEKEIAIEVKPTFWNSYWAYLIYTIGIILLLVGYRKYTIVRTEEKHDFNVAQVEKAKSEELQQMKLEFFTNISHEFRTPLTLIKGPLDYLEKNDIELNSEDRIKQYGLMRKNADYLLRLVNQLLDFRRLDKEKMKLNFINLEIKSFINETIGPFLFMANKKNVDFKIEAPNKDINITADPDALEKILNNLLFNAFKFTPENQSITIKINYGLDFENPSILNKKIDLADYIVIQIKDTGKGIKPEKLEHIFERYYVEKKQNIQGAGIGLSFTKSLVELHEGFITVQSTVGKGTTFFIILPIENKSVSYGKMIELEKELEEEKISNLAPDLKSITSELRSDIEKQEYEVINQKKPKLLLIDDNDDIRTFVKHGLSKDFVVIEATNGEEGLETALREIPSIIVTDIMMPIMDGMEMSERLKEDQKTSHIPIIMLTAKSGSDTERLALEIGAEDFIRKPFDLDVLTLKIKKIGAKRDILRDKYKKTVSLEPQEVAVTSIDEKFLKKAMSIVEDNMMNTEFSVEMLVSEMGMSRSNLYLKLKEITGLSSSEFIRSVRLKRAVQLIKKSDMSVKEIMYMTGFNTASYFSKCFKKQYGMVPSEYVKSLKTNTKSEILSNGQSQNYS